MLRTEFLSEVSPIRKCRLIGSCHVVNPFNGRKFAPPGEKSIPAQEILALPVLTVHSEEVSRLGSNTL